MSTEPNVASIRSYFARYELNPCSFDAHVPVNLEHDLQDCNCVLKCCLKFLPEARLLLRDGYQRLTPKGRAAFLATHTPRAGQTQYRLPADETGLQKVCMVFFMNTLQETRDRVREVLGKRKVVSPDVGYEEHGENSEEILPDKLYKMESDVEEEGAELTEENGFKGFPMDIDCVKEERFEQEVNDTEQLILPDGPSANNREVTKVNDLDDKILPDRDESGNSCNVPVKQEPVDIKTEANELEADNHDFALALPGNAGEVDEELFLDPEGDDEESTSGNHLSFKQRKIVAANFRKECKLRGLSYINDCGKIIPGRSVKSNCGASCKIQCRTRVPEEVRLQLLSNLLQMSFKDQRKFINDHICIMPVANSKVLSGRRSLSLYYFLPVESRLVRVCKTMFLNTYDIGKKEIRRINAHKIGDKHVVCDNPNFPAVLLKKASNKFYFEYDEGCDQPVKIAQHGGCKCNLRCGSMFSEKEIARIRNSLRRKSKEEQENFLSKHMQLSPGKRERYKSAFIRTRFFLPLESTIKEVCRQMFQNTFKLTTRQVSSLLKNLPENPDLPVELENDPRMEMVLCPNVLDVNGTDFKILPDCDASNSVNEVVEHDPMEIKSEPNELETDHREFLVVLPRDDDSIDEELLVDPDADGDQDDNSSTDSQSEVLLLEDKEEEPSSRKFSKKKSKLRGLSYISSKGLTIPARTVKPNCGTSCHFQCQARVSEELRQQLLTNLLQMSLAKQRNFIGSHICCMPAANSVTGRQFNHYFLPVESRLVKVCKTMFMATYDLTDKKIRIIVAKKSGDKQLVCGNPNFPQLLKMGSKFYFDYDEGYDLPQTVCKCNLLCANLFSEEVIEQIQSTVREISTKDRDEFFSKHIQLFNDKRIQNKNPLFRARYFLPRRSTDLVEVCRSMFQHAFKLNRNQVRILVENHPLPLPDPLELAREHIAAHRMDEDHHCAVSGESRKLSHSPNVAQLYSEYREERCRCWGVEAIDYRQYFGEFCQHFAKTGLLLLTSCPDCGYYDKGEGG